MNETGGANEGWLESLVNFFCEWILFNLLPGLTQVTGHPSVQDEIIIELVSIWTQAASICLHDLIPKVMFLHFNQFCGGAVFIDIRNTGIVCWGYFLSLWDDLVCVTALLALGLEQSNTHSITPVTLAVNCALSQAVCYNLNLYFVSECDDLTEKNKGIYLDLHVSLEEVRLHLEV